MRTLVSREKILIVEDEPTTIKHIEKILSDLDYDVLAVVSTGEEAIEKAGKLNPDIILIDIVLSGKMNGIDATRAIKQFRRDLPIIAQTAFSYNNEDERILEAGCIKVITKPISPQVLISSILEYM